MSTELYSHITLSSSLEKVHSRRTQSRFILDFDLFHLDLFLLLIARQFGQR